MEEQPAADHVEVEPRSLKRKSSPRTDRQSESPKRTRTEREDRRTGDLSLQGSQPPPRQTEPSRRSLEDARARVSQEEKRRGMRLFGGLLGTLNQRPTGSQQQKRLEIEKRQQERLKQQRLEEQKVLEEKKANLQQTRMKESIKWDEKVLHVRHSTLRSKARFLRTNARPHIYYKPWILTADQKSEIQQQRHDTEDMIERELDEFEARKEAHARKYGLEIQPAERRASPEPAEVEKAPEPSGEREPEGHAQEERPPSSPAPDREHHDESNDVVVESGEDVVIY